jgi:hypothetical protein
VWPGKRGVGGVDGLPGPLNCGNLVTSKVKRACCLEQHGAVALGVGHGIVDLFDRGCVIAKLGQRESSSGPDGRAVRSHAIKVKIARFFDLTVDKMFDPEDEGKADR